MTEEAGHYYRLSKDLAEHRFVRHGKGGISPLRTVASIRIRVRATSLSSKWGMKGIYQHCAEKHLHRYLAD